MANDKIKHSRTSSRRAGFTLMEVSAGLALLSIAITFLPAVQKQREAYNKTAAEKALHVAGAAVVKGFQTGGKVPNSLDELIRLAGAPIKTGQVSGYQLTLLEAKPDVLRITAEPIPGVTGSETGYLEVRATQGVARYSLVFAPTAGADAGRRALWSSVGVAAARGFGRLAGLLPAVQTEDALKLLRREVESPARQQAAFETLRSPNGAVTFESILAHIASYPLLADNSLSEELRKALELGARGEEIANLPGLSTLPAVQNSDKLLGFSRIGVITDALVTEPAPELGAALRKHLTEAEAAEARRDMAGVHAAVTLYREALKQNADRQFTSSRGQDKKIGFVPFVHVASLMSLVGAMQQ